jgi:hypothetical protein
VLPALPVVGEWSKKAASLPVQGVICQRKSPMLISYGSIYQIISKNPLFL